MPFLFNFRKAKQFNISLNNLIFIYFDNILEINKSDNNIIKNKLKKINNAYIRPVYSNGEGYNSIILMKKNNNSNSPSLISLKEYDEKPADFLACLLSVGMGKKKQKILTRNFHKKNTYIIKKHFLKRFNINIVEFHLKYIFPLERKESIIINVLRKKLDLMLFDNKNKFVFYNLNKKMRKYLLKIYF